MPVEDRFRPDSAFQPIPGVWEWTTPDGICCLTFGHDVVTDASIDLEAENFILRQRGAKDRDGNPLILNNVQDYFIKVRAPELGGVDSPLFQQEYRNAWDANTKKLAAFYRFDFSVHTRYYVNYIEQGPVHIFIDFGEEHPCAGIAQADRYSNTGASNHTRTHFHFHDCIRGHGVDLEAFLEELISYANKEFSNCKQIWTPVQEGANRGSTGIRDSKDGAGTPIEKMRAKKLNIQTPIWSKVKPRVDRTNELLNTYDNGRPIFNFNPSCRDWVEMLEGGYRKRFLTRDGATIISDSYVKDNYHDHLADGFTGWCVTNFGKSGVDKNKIPHKIYSNYSSQYKRAI